MEAKIGNYATWEDMNGETHSGKIININSGLCYIKRDDRTELCIFPVKEIKDIYCSDIIERPTNKQLERILILINRYHSDMPIKLKDGTVEYIIKKWNKL